VPRGRGVQVGTTFGEGPPPKIWEGKKRLKFGAISDNYRLWSWISPERIHISKIGKVVDQLLPLPRCAKKIWWTLVHKQKSYRRSFWATQIAFFDRLHFGPWGLLAPQVFTRARNWSRLGCAPPGWPHVGLCPIFLVYSLYAPRYDYFVADFFTGWNKHRARWCHLPTFVTIYGRRLPLPLSCAWRYLTQKAWLNTGVSVSLVFIETVASESNCDIMRCCCNLLVMCRLIYQKVGVVFLQVQN